ncbi:MAG TPA: hypothetical protein P5102_16580 [Candidatus Competibacteraceae bacterium]|nr:hypothetical protein [Candidatus Competibacteraceae bacterium]HRZ07726.1 hypothetical protein [Candidatus Competibacteraceae bacterium]
MEIPPPYHVGPTDSAEPPLTTEDLVAHAHAQRQGIPYETGEQWLERLPERLRALADLILGGKMQGGDVAYAVAALIDRIESAPTDARRMH